MTSGIFILAHERLGELAVRETRSATMIGSAELPPGQYTFWEAYCSDPQCDCRKVRPQTTMPLWERQELQAMLR